MSESIKKENSDLPDQELTVVIVDLNASDLRVNEANMAIVNWKLMDAFYQQATNRPNERMPVVNTKERFHGYPIITCDSQKSVDFLTEEITKNGGFFMNLKLAVMFPNELTLFRKVHVTVPLCSWTKTTELKSVLGEKVLKLLAAQNPDVPIHKWKLHKVGTQIGTNVIITFTVIDEDTNTKLSNIQTLNLAMNKVAFEVDKNHLIIQKTENEEEKEINFDLI